MAAISAATVKSKSPTLNSTKTTSVTLSSNIKTVGTALQLAVSGLTSDQILDGYVRDTELLQDKPQTSKLC